MQYINVKHSKGANVCPMIMSVDAHEKQNLKSAFCYKPEVLYESSAIGCSTAYQKQQRKEILK